MYSTVALIAKNDLLKDSFASILAPLIIFFFNLWKDLKCIFRIVPLPPELQFWNANSSVSSISPDARASLIKFAIERDEISGHFDIIKFS